MPDAFDQGRADFSGMTDAGKGIWIDDVIHEARIAVDEQGTEAAAASAVVMKKGGGAVRADHPFLFLIRERESGAFLFLGRVADPSASS
jgi:serpin B